MKKSAKMTAIICYRVQFLRFILLHLVVVWNVREKFIWTHILNGPGEKKLDQKFWNLKFLNYKKTKEKKQQLRSGQRYHMETVALLFI